MNDLLNTTLGAVGQVGDAFDKFTGGRALRGTLAGKPRELLSVLPFSDTVGITDAKDKTSGRDLTDSYGLTRKGDDSFGAGALGFAADTILSPGNLIGGAAAFKAAPTLTKGLTSGAKALTGLDAFESLGRGLGRLAKGEAGAAKIPNAAHLNDSLRKYLPWAGQPDIPSSVREAAAYIGPQYPGGRDKLLGAIQGHENWGRGLLADSLANHPGVEKIASEVPEGSKFLGNGTEAVAIRTPQGGVIRMAPSVSSFGSAGRADIPEILQPFRSLQIPGDPRTGHSPWIVEHLPMVDPVWPGDGVFDKAEEIGKRMDALGVGPDAIQDYVRMTEAQKLLNDGSNYLAHDLRRVVQANHPSLNPWDFHGGNVAMTREGSAVGHDGGMVSSMPGQPPIERWSPRLQRPASMAEAEQLGASDAVREAIAKGLSAGTRGQGVLEVPGSDLAAILANQSYVKEFMAKYEPLLSMEPTELRGVTGVAPPVQPAMPSVSATPAAPYTPFRGLATKKLPGPRIDSAQAAMAPSFAGRQSGSGMLGTPGQSASVSMPTSDLPWERAVRIGEEAGIPTSLHGALDAYQKLLAAGHSDDSAKSAFAWYSGKANEIGLNDAHLAWSDNDLMQRMLANLGPSGRRWFSSAHPNAIMDHELGHAMHRNAMGLDEYRHSSLLKSLPKDHAKYLNAHLGQYAATSPHEAVAEIVSAVKGNRQFDPSTQQNIAKILNHYGGSNLWQMMGDQKMLKPLGYSLLAALGLGAGAASTNQPEAN